MKHFVKATALAAAATVALMASSASAAVIYYIGGFSNNFYKYDTVAATETFIGLVGLNADSVGLSFASSGALYAFERSSQSLYTINTSSGATTLIGNAGIAAEDFTLNLAGTLGYATSGNSLYSINLATGASTLIGSAGGLSTTLDGLTTAPVAVTVAGNNYAAGTVFGIDTRTVYVVNVTTGALTSIGSTNGADETFDFGGGTLYGHNDDGFLYTINLATLAGTQLAATTPQLVFGMAVAPGAVQGAVPEPGTWMMMIAGFGIAGFSLRARRRRTPALV